MNTTGNKRYKETEDKIQKSFLMLLENKQINEISVNDICKLAHISRPSFYSHYEDINDLILKIEYEKSSYISTILTTPNPLSINDFIKYLSYVKANKNFYTAYFKCENNSYISQHMMDQYLSINRMDNTPLLRYHMLFFMAGLKAIVYDWLNKNCPESVEQMSQVLMEQYALFNQQ